MAKKYYLIELNIPDGRLDYCEEVDPETVAQSLKGSVYFANNTMQTCIEAKNAKDAQKIAANYLKQYKNNMKNNRVVSKQDFSHENGYY